MKPANPNPRLFVSLTCACLFGLGAAHAYANDGSQGQVGSTKTAAVPASAYSNSAADLESTSRIWVHEKTAVSQNPPVESAQNGIVTVVRADEPLPQLIVPLNTDMDMMTRPVPELSETHAYDKTLDLRQLDLVEDSPVFIGAQGATEFDTRDAIRERAAYPKSIEVEPFYTVAGAGIETSF